MRPKVQFERAVTTAYECLVKNNVRALPVDVESLLSHYRNTHVLDVEQAADMLNKPTWLLNKDLQMAEAWTYRMSDAAGETHYVVLLRREGVHPARLRFNMAHELGHIALGHEGSNENEEREANCFAMHLLCPVPVLREMMNGQKQVWAEQVAAKCFVSVAAVQSIARRPARPVRRALENQVAELLEGQGEAYLVHPARTRLWHRVPVGTYVSGAYDPEPTDA